MMIYQGKQSDSSSAVLSMALQAIGLINIQHLECLTTRPFSIRCTKDNKLLWLSPFVEPLEGLLTAIRLLKVNHKSQVISPDYTYQNFLNVIKQWLKDGPVILGPLDRTKIWDRLASRFYKGDAYFLLLIGCDQKTRFIVHDPEGCPYFLISPEKMLNSFDYFNYQTGIIQLQSTLLIPSYEDTLISALQAGIRTRLKASAHDECGSKGLYLLADEIASRKLKSSEAGGLYFALPALGLAAKHVLDLLRNILNLDIHINTQISGIVILMESLISQDITIYAQALEYLALNDQNKLSECFLKLADNWKILENQLKLTGLE